MKIDWPAIVVKALTPTQRAVLLSLDPRGGETPIQGSRVIASLYCLTGKPIAPNVEARLVNFHSTSEFKNGRWSNAGTARLSALGVRVRAVLPEPPR